jgi:sensor histidine kinase YesM
MYLNLNYIVEQYLLNKKNLRLLQEQKEKIELEQMYKDMELRYYASQINPHFLFNALNIAGRQAYLENAEKTQEVIYALADMYRGYLISTDLLISVTEELRNVKNYIFIQHNRFGEQLKYEQDIPEEILKVKIPAMTLQIFIENSIRHGLEKKEDLGFVRLTASKINKSQKEYVLFEICDNGVGIPEDVYASLKCKRFDSFNLSSSRGIYSVYKKLSYYFQSDFDMEFYSDPRNGARVKLTIPTLR